MRVKDFEGKRLFPQSKAAEIYGVCSKTVDRWAARGLIDPPIRINGRKYISEASIDKVIAAKAA